MTIQDALPVEARYQRQAKAAVEAAKTAIRDAFGSYSGPVESARVEAVGRIASALILADREQP